MRFGSQNFSAGYFPSFSSDTPVRHRTSHQAVSCSLLRFGRMGVQDCNGWTNPKWNARDCTRLLKSVNRDFHTWGSLNVTDHYNPHHPHPNHHLQGQICHINPTHCGGNLIKPVYQYTCWRNLHDIFVGLIVDKVNHHQDYFLLPIRIPLSFLLVIAILSSIVLLIPEDPHVLR